MADQREKLLDLPGGRVLAYEDGGNPNSKTIVIFFHGGFNVGDAAHLSPVLLKHDVHYIAPTLPGWGNSSIRADPYGVPYYVGLAQDTIALLEHLHPGCSNAPDGEYKLYVSGLSYGTVAAQMIFNAPLEAFPPGRHTVACLLLAPSTLFKYHEDYAKSMTWGNYISIGPPSRYIPWRLIQRLGSMVLKRKLENVENAERFVGQLFDDMQEGEKVLFEKWRKERGLEEGELERHMAANMVKSVGKSWDGFLETTDVVHGDWGFRPEEMSKKPVIVVTSKDDKMTPGAWAKWLVEKYPNARLKEVTGGHIAGLWSIDSIWEEVLNVN